MAQTFKKTYADPWKEYTKRYEKFYWAPGKPTNHEGKIFYGFIKDSFKNNKGKKSVLVLGATPAVRDTLARFNTEITLLDATKAIMKSMTKLIKHKKQERFFEGSWLDMPFSDNSFDVVAGDLILGNIDAKNKQKFLKEVKRVLKPKGYFVHRIFYVPLNWKKDSTEKVLQRFAKMDQKYNRNTELFMYLLYNTYNPKTHEVYASIMKKEIDKYRKRGKYVYSDPVVEMLMNEAYEMWKPFKKIWHTGLKREVFSWISKEFNIIRQDYAKDHKFAKTFPVIMCRAK